VSAAVVLRRLLVAYGLALLAAGAGLWLWLAPVRAPAAGAAAIASAWQGGERRARVVAGDDASAAAAVAAAAPGATVVVEHVTGERRVLALSRRLFSLSFVAGRDGVHARLDGRDAYLTPDDLLHDRLYRRTSGIDTDGALDRLAGQLGCSRDALWGRGRFRRFTVARAVQTTGAAPPAADADAAARRVTTASVPRLMLAARDAAAFLVQRQLPDGRFADAGGAPLVDPATGRYDWRAHAAATAFLVEMGERINDGAIKGSGMHGAWAMRAAGSSPCGAETCVGEGEHVDTDVTAVALLAYSDMATQRMGTTFRQAAAAASAFLRSQQWPGGGFAAAYDRFNDETDAGERGDVDAAVVLALARAHRVTKNPADLEAARLGLRHLAGAPMLVGMRDVLGADPRLCQAVDELWDRAPDRYALALCLRWTGAGALLQIDRRGPVPEHGGGFSAGPGWTPDLGFTAARTEGAIATLAAAMRAGRSPESLRALDVRVAGALELLLRQQLPGARETLVADPKRVAGGFARSASDLDPTVADTAAAGASMLHCVRAIEVRTMPQAPSSTRRRSRAVPP
jgi:hypothetical protein